MSYSTALPLTLPSLTSDRRQQLLEEQPLLSLYEVFATIPDPRSKQGLRYELAYLLICLVAAFLCNCDSTLAVAQWCRDQHLLLIRLFGPRRAPRAQAIHSIANSCRVWMPNRSSAPWRTGYAVPCKPNQLIPLPEMARRFVVPGRLKVLLPICSLSAHIRVRKRCCKSSHLAKTNEIPIAQALLPCLPVAGRVFTADALHTQKDFMLCVDALGGKTVLTVKNNQPTLFADLATYFADPHACCQQDETWDRRRGRVEHRVIRVSTEMNVYLAPAWPLIQQVAEVTRTVTVRKTGQTSHEVVYLITPLTPQEACPSRLLELVRGHWGIENSSHYVRDVTFGEDRSPLRSGQGPQIMAAFRNLAITLIHRQGSSQIAATRRHFASHPRLAFRLLLPRRSAQQ